jgi:hypothetical protein
MADWQPVSEEVPFEERLERAFQVNIEINRGKDFWAFFNRILIYHYRTLDPQRASTIAREELDLLEHDPRLRAKQRLYLLGEYSRLSGDSSAALAFFGKAGNTSINRELALLVFAANSLCLLVGLWVVWRYRRRFFTIVAVAGAVLVLIVSVKFYFKNRQSDTYYDQIIADRMALITNAAVHEVAKPNNTEAGGG